MAVVRSTQQILTIAYNTAAALRVSAIAVEVIRSQSGTDPFTPARVAFFQTADR